MIIAFTGLRHAGKSTAAAFLQSRFGFRAVHAFGVGKEMAELYLLRVTGDCDLAQRMAYGDLRDQPSEHLPGNAKPREFLERFGHFMGVDMGPEWTLSMEERKARRLFGAGADLVFESIIYESEALRKMGAVIVRLERIGYDHPDVQSNAAQAVIRADHTIRAGSVKDLKAQLENLVLDLQSMSETFGS